MMPVRNKDAGIRMPICNKEDRSASSNRKKEPRSRFGMTKAAVLLRDGGEERADLGWRRPRCRFGMEKTIWD